MNRTIEKCEYYKQNMIHKALETAKKEYEEAEGSYNQTGYDRYWNMMQRREQEIKELEAYLEKDKAAESLISERRELEREKAACKEKLEQIKKDLLNKLFYLLKVIPDCAEAKSLEAYINKLDV